uniref:DUF58 domain-containing protein n=1 Tax=Ignisphaera aggregans TaxID=334771 RepID=A0A7J3I873_9CREN
MPRNIRDIIKWLSLVYAIASLVYILYITKSPYTAIPLITLIIVNSIKKYRKAIPFSVYATMFFISMALDEGIYLSTPLAITIPFIIGQSNIKDELQKRFILGPSALDMFRYLLISSLLMLVDLRVLIPIMLSASTIIVYAIYSYVKLSKVSTDISLINNTVSWGEKVSALLNVNTSMEINLVLEYGGNRNVYTVKGKAIFDIELPINHVGRHIIEVNVYVLDSFYFSCRFIGKHEIEYNVIPLTQRALEVIGEYIREAVGISSPAIEISISELSEGSTITTRTQIENVRALYGYTYRVKRGIYLGALLEKFLESLEEIARKTGEGEGYKRSRYGEYIGSRPYIPGDSLRFIHWKKSASRGSLVIKEFGSSSIEESLLNHEGEGEEPLIIVDLYAPNAQELDRLIYVFLQQCFKVFKQSPRSKILLVIIIGDMVISLKGRSADIVHQLYRVFSKTPIQTLFNYTSIQSPTEDNIVEILKNDKRPKPLAILVVSNEMFADELVKVILGNDFMPPRPFTLIYSNSLEFRYVVVKHVLHRLGFIYTNNFELINQFT